MEIDFAELTTLELEQWITNERKEVGLLRDIITLNITERDGEATGSRTQEEESNGSVS